MSTAGTLRAIVQRHVRDVNGTRHADAFVLDILSRVQRIINAGSQKVLVTGTLTTSANLQLYTINTEFTAGIDVIRVRSNNEDLTKVTLQELNQLDRRWFRKVGSRFEMWAQLGRTLLVVHPALSVASSVEVVYSKLTTDLTADGTSLDLDADNDPMVTDLTEAILHLRQRDYQQSGADLQRFVTSFGLEAKGVDLSNVEVGHD